MIKLLVFGATEECGSPMDKFFTNDLSRVEKFETKEEAESFLV